MPLTLCRRELVAGILASSFASTSCAQAPGKASAAFIPEAFGAAGDGRSDDYPALRRLVSAVNSAGGGMVRFQRGRNYFLGRHVERGNGIGDLAFDSCDGLTLEGEGAIISVKSDFRRDQATTRGLAGLLFRDCRNVTIRNLELDGNVGRTVRIESLPEAPTHGLAFHSCFDVFIDQLLVHHFAADGLYIRNSRQTGQSGSSRASRRFTVRNSRFLFNARQGLSIIQLRGALFQDCEFSFTGYIDPHGTRGPYGSHSPSAGVDIEPNRTPSHPSPVDVLTGEIAFKRCRMIGNGGAAFVAAKYAGGRAFVEQIRLESCQLECNQGETGGKDGFIFDVPRGQVVGCTLQMFDKTAYLGWYRQNEASPEFRGNTIYGRNPNPNRPMFAVRPTRGAPKIEGNRFIGQQKQAKPTSASWLVRIDNPNATVRNNHLFIPGQAFPRYGNMVAAVLANARLMEGNRYETDLDSSWVPGSGFFGVLYSSGTSARNEIFRGTRRGPQDSIRPANAATRKPLSHDTSVPFSR